jgi:arylsulfatase A-like enzyme
MPSCSRRCFLETGLAASMTASVSPWVAGMAAASNEGRRPNLVFLLTDDQRWDSLGCMGNPIIQTPNIDSLAREGILFKNHFVTTAICCSSRATIFSGRYAGSMDLHRFDKPLPEEIWRTSYPMLLRAAGYRTGFIGKFGLGDPLPGKDFDFWEGFPGQGNFYEDKPFEGKHLTRRMGEQAGDFLKGCRPEQPFCLSVSFKAPHSNPEVAERPFAPDTEDLNLYSGIEIPLAKTACEASRQRLPEFLRESEGHIRREAWFKDVQETTRDYYRLITGVDRAIGEILAQLDQNHLRENTVIIFTSDNGYFLGEKGFEGKWLMYEESIRTPLVIYDPRLPASNRGRHIDPMTLNLDLAPTLLGLAGVEVPRPMKGRSLVPFIQGESPSWRTDWYYEHLFAHPKIPRNEGVRTDRWKYIRYIDIQPVYEELYDLTNDPFEETNLASIPEHQTVLKTLRERCEQLKRESLSA